MGYAMDMNKKIILSIIGIVVLSVVVYFPSLTGDFIYDDFWSLKKLSEVNGVISWESLSAYLLSSDTGPLKRPLSMLSFLIDGQDWPADPYSFRVTNLIIHIINSLLLFCLLYSILKLRENKNVVCVALFATLLWMLHPFLVSTVAYVVQRMAMLPVFFALLSMLLYLKIRLRYKELSFIKSSVYLSLTIYGLSMAAALSKENGLLILLYIPLFEYFICQKYLNIAVMKSHAKRLFTAGPVALLVLALVVKFPDFYQGYTERDFSLYERLLSEPRALTKYIFHWAAPSVLTEGIYTDTFTASSSLFNPISTLFSLLFIGFLIMMAFLLRHKAPLLSFAILFYFASHVIESSFIPLQLYFEHRNYSAFLFLSFPLVLAIVQGVKNKQLAWLVLISISLLLMSQTFLRSHLWGDSIRMKIATLEAFPESIRARIGVVELLEDDTNYKKALVLLENGINIKAAPSLYALKSQIKCKFENISQADTTLLTDSLVSNGMKRQDILPIASLIQTVLNDECAHPDGKLERLEEVLSALEAQLDPNVPLGWSMYYYARGRLAHRLNNYRLSTEYFIESFKQDKEYKEAIMAASQLLISKQPELALKLLEIVEREYDNSLIVNLRLENEINKFLTVTKEEISAKNEYINHNPSQE